MNGTQMNGTIEDEIKLITFKFDHEELIHTLLIMFIFLINILVIYIKLGVVNTYPGGDRQPWVLPCPIAPCSRHTAL